MHLRGTYEVMRINYIFLIPFAVVLILNFRFHAMAEYAYNFKNNIITKINMCYSAEPFSALLYVDTFDVFVSINSETGICPKF